METTLATILITSTITVVVIGLGYMIWAIEKLKHKVSNLEGLCINFERQIDDIYREFDNQNEKHDRKLESLKNLNDENFYALGERLDKEKRDFERQNEFMSRYVDETNQRIDRNSDELERALDKRFDSVYRKLYNSKTINEPLEGSISY